MMIDGALGFVASSFFECDVFVDELFFIVIKISDRSLLATYRALLHAVVGVVS